MNAIPVLLRTALASAVCAAAAMSAQATPVYTTSSLSGYTPTLFPHYTLNGNAHLASSSAMGLYAMPVGIPAGGQYLYASPSDGVIDVTAINASSFSFLWGSPDWYNNVTYHTSLGDFLYTGVMLGNDFGVSTSGDTSISTVFTASLGNTGTINSVTFTSQNIAFEVDGVSKIPEPGSVALVATALGALVWTGRRRQG